MGFNVLSLYSALGAELFEGVKKLRISRVDWQSVKSVANRVGASVRGQWTRIVRSERLHSVLERDVLAVEGAVEDGGAMMTVRLGLRAMRLQSDGLGPQLPSDVGATRGEQRKGAGALQQLLGRIHDAQDRREQAAHAKDQSKDAASAEYADDSKSLRANEEDVQSTTAASGTKETSLPESTSDIHLRSSENPDGPAPIAATRFRGVAPHHMSAEERQQQPFRPNPKHRPRNAPSRTQRVTRHAQLVQDREWMAFRSELTSAPDAATRVRFSVAIHSVHTPMLLTTAPGHFKRHCPTTDSPDFDDWTGAGPPESGYSCAGCGRKGSLAPLNPVSVARSMLLLIQNRRSLVSFLSRSCDWDGQKVEARPTCAKGYPAPRRRRRTEHRPDPPPLGMTAHTDTGTLLTASPADPAKRSPFSGDSPPFRNENLLAPWELVAEEEDEDEEE
ncbi:hypothetical protein LTR28_003234 [Elasticomyces elasticus]|nr:hypothetical protein LTR28_003234 [Elasticomyces elasticus]